MSGRRLIKRVGGRRLTVALLAGAAAFGYSAGSTGSVDAAAPGGLVFTLTAPLPKFPCASCVTSISGTAAGAIHGAANFTAATGKLSGSASYFETGCPPLSGTANGVIDVAMKDGSAPATAAFNFHYQREGLVAVITGTGVVQDNSGAHRTPFAGTSVGIFTATIKAGEFKPPCTPSPQTVMVTGVIATH